MSMNPPDLSKPLTFVLAYAQAVSYLLNTDNARLPLLPSGKAFNVEYQFIGTLPAQGASIQQLLNPPFGSGPVYLDGTVKEFVSLIGEYTIANLDPTSTLKILLSTQSNPNGILKATLPPGAAINETDRELHPLIMRLVNNTPNTTMQVQVSAWCYGAGR